MSIDELQRSASAMTESELQAARAALSGKIAKLDRLLKHRKDDEGLANDVESLRVELHVIQTEINGRGE